MGSVAERSKALVLGTSLFGGVGSNPTAATSFYLFYLPRVRWEVESLHSRERLQHGSMV